MNDGTLSVLNVGAGDIHVTFNTANADETAKAIEMLLDMQRRGYFIAIELPDGTYTRATSIDATQGRYILTVPTDVADPPGSEPVTCSCGCGAAVKPGKRYLVGHHNRGKNRHGHRKVSVPVTRAKAVGVARSAGG